MIVQLSHPSKDTMVPNADNDFDRSNETNEYRDDELNVTRSTPNATPSFLRFLLSKQYFCCKQPQQLHNNNNNTLQDKSTLNFVGVDCVHRLHRTQRIRVQVAACPPCRMWSLTSIISHLLKFVLLFFPRRCSLLVRRTCVHFPMHLILNAVTHKFDYGHSRSRARRLRVRIGWMRETEIEREIETKKTAQTKAIE